MTRACAEIKILRPTSLGFSIFGIVFFALPFSPFLLFLRQWLTCYWACLRLKNFGESVIETGNFKHGAARWSGRKFCYQVFHSTFWAFLCIFKAPLGRSLWSGHHWKDLFLLQKLSIDDANFGQKRWRQKRKKGQGSSRAVTGGTGVNGLKWKRKQKQKTNKHKTVPQGCRVFWKVTCPVQYTWTCSVN